MPQLDRRVAGEVVDEVAVERETSHLRSVPFELGPATVVVDAPGRVHSVAVFCSQRTFEQRVPRVHARVQHADSRRVVVRWCCPTSKVLGPLGLVDRLLLDEERRRLLGTLQLGDVAHDVERTCEGLRGGEDQSDDAIVELDTAR